jgi:hypothetical protein
MRSAWVLEVTLGALMVAVMIALGWRLAEFLALPFGELRHVKMLARCGRRKTPMPRPARSPEWGSFCTVVGRASVWERSTAGLERAAVILNRMGIERSRYRGGSGGGWEIRME